MKKILTLQISALFTLSVVYAQDTKIRFFGQPGFDFAYNTKSEKSAPYFRSGPIVLFGTSQLNEKFSVASELHAHYMAVSGAEVEIERIYMNYTHTEKFTVSAGKMYTPIGFWNNNYNFGLILQPVIDRPLILNPQHDGGFMLTRDVGVQVSGENIGASRFFYKAFLSNGIGKNGGYLGNAPELGSSLAFSGQVGLEPVDGLKIFASGLVNPLNSGDLNENGDTITQSLTYAIANGGITFLNPDYKLEFIGEYFSNMHFTSSTSSVLHGAVGYLGYKVNDKVIPYVATQVVVMPDNDLFYNQYSFYLNQKAESNYKFSGGLRFRAAPTLILKAELQATFYETIGTTLGAKTQIAFVY